MRSDKELLGIQNALVVRAESVDFLFVGECDLTEEEIEYIQELGDRATEKYELD